MESLTQSQIKTNIILLPHTYHLPKITLPTTKNQQIARNIKRNIPSSAYHKIYQRKVTSIHTHLNYL